jgi:hypothetical protein
MLVKIARQLKAMFWAVLAVFASPESWKSHQLI